MLELRPRRLLRRRLQADAGRRRARQGRGHRPVRRRQADHWVEQTEQLGTGHAAQDVRAAPARITHGDVFILAGDGPLIRGEVLRTLRNAHRDDHAAASMATAVLDDPTGYGRIIRDDDGRVRRDRRADRRDAGAARDSRGLPELSTACKVDDLLFALAQAEEREQEGRVLPDRHLRHPPRRPARRCRGAGGDGRRRARRQHAASSSPRSTRSCRTASSGSCARPA